MSSIYDTESTSIYDNVQPTPEVVPESVARTKAAYTALASGAITPDTPAKAGIIFRDLASTGSSIEEEKVLSEAEKELATSKQDAILSTVKEDLPPEEKAAKVEAIRIADVKPDVVTEAEISMAAQYEPASPATAATHKARLQDKLLRGAANNLLEIHDLRNSINSVREEVREATADGNQFPEFAELFLMPGLTGEAYVSVLGAVFPDTPGLLAGAVAAGEAQQILSDKFKALPDDQLVEHLDLLKKSLIEDVGIITGNGVQAQIMIDEIFAEELGHREKGDFNFDRLFNNVAGVADGFAIIGAVLTAPKALLRFSRMRSFGKVMSSLDNVNPEKARDLRAALLATGDKSVEDMVGVTPEDVFTELYPTYDGALNSVTPAGVVDAVADMQLQLNKIEEDVTFGINYTQEEIGQMQRNVKEAYDLVDGSYHQSFSELKFTEDEGKGFTIKAAYGPSNDVGFADKATALEHFRTNFPEGTKVDFMVKDGPVVRQAQPGDDGLETWYRVEREYTYNAALIDENELLFGSAVIDKAGGIQEAYNTTKPYILDPASRFDRTTARTATHANDMGQGLQARMIGLFKDSFLSLGKGSQRKVMDVIDEGSKLNTNFTYQELLGKGLSEKERVSYFKLRGIMDLEWKLNNARIRNTLDRDGYKSVVNYDKGFETFGRPLEKDGLASSYKDGRIKVFDPDSNTIVALTPADVDTLYSNGGQVLRSKSALTDSREGVTLVASGLGEGTRVRPLTNTPLQYRPGYVTRFYDENYFVKAKKTSIVDGVAQTKLSTIAAAPTSKEASSLMAALKSNNPELELVKELDRALDPVQRFDDEFEYLHRTGGIVTGRRGDHLKGLQDAQAATIDPIQSMVDSLTYTANRVSHDDALAGLERRWVNTFGAKYGEHTSIPTDIKSIKGSTPTASGVQEARMYAQYIQGLKGLQSDSANAWRGAMITVAEHLDNLFDGGRKGKAITDVVRNFNPLRSARSLNFNVLLASNPARQLLLQANQITFLAGMRPGYILSGKAGAHTAAFAVAAATRNRPMWGTVRPKLAKVMGMSEKDFEYMYDGFVRSGMPQSIDNHTFARDGVQNAQARLRAGPVERVGRGLTTLAKAPVSVPIGIARKVGFNAGEWTNISMTWLTALDDFKKKNPGRNWKTKGVMDMVSAEARDLALNMTRTGELPYQRGFLSLATQFMSYQHKVFLALAGQNKAYSSLTKTQRVGIVAAQVALYGADGLGLGTKWDKIKDSYGIEAPEEVNEILDGFVYEYITNGLINTLTSDDTDIDFTATLAPAGGVLGSFENLIGNLMASDLPSALLGATSSTVSRIDTALRTSAVAWEIPDLNNLEKLEATVQQLGQIFGGYSNYVKGHAMQQVGYAISNSGQPLFKTTYSEGLAKQLFGINPESQDDYYRIAQGVRGPFSPRTLSEMVGGPSDDDIQGIAETYYNKVLKIYREMNIDSLESFDDLWYNQLSAKISLNNTLLAVLPEDVSYAVRKAVQERVDRNINTTGYDDMVRYMAKASLGGSVSENTKQYYVNMLTNAEFKLDPMQIKNIEAMLDDITAVTEEQ